MGLAKPVGLTGGGDDMVKEAGDGEGADAADFGGDGGEVSTVSDFVGEVAL